MFFYSFEIAFETLPGPQGLQYLGGSSRRGGLDQFRVHHSILTSFKRFVVVVVRFPDSRISLPDPLPLFPLPFLPHLELGVVEADGGRGRGQLGRPRARHCHGVQSLDHFCLSHTGRTSQFALVHCAAAATPGLEMREGVLQYPIFPMGRCTLSVNPVYNQSQKE